MKTHYIINESTEHIEYKVIEENDTFTLYYSNAEHWTYPNNEIIQATEYGNGIKFSTKTPKDMDYSTFEHLHILMMFIRKNLRNDNYLIITK